MRFPFPAVPWGRLALTLCTFLLAGCDGGNEVGDVSLGLFTTKDIKIESLTDPKVPGVTCHLSNIDADLDLADPSDTSLACRQTGPITTEMLADIDTSADGELLYRRSQSVLFKSLKLRRIFDAESQTLLYLAYSTKETSGSFKHALSSVPLWGTQAWRSSEPR
ncbi:CreA family protein [Halomonas sp. M4R1S46]|uniref:CreA family protein n=1 Tax=Halomonas sp. M4R1S46 TaxID=2982692 RepID=UPI0021E4847F|nr:CreA family protein [Halomonas sp. M4R1S46]UYG06959.1 CreA family protein [Halomonas sp. M4R1S46]